MHIFRGTLCLNMWFAMICANAALLLRFLLCVSVLSPPGIGSVFGHDRADPWQGWRTSRAHILFRVCVVPYVKHLPVRLFLCCMAFAVRRDFLLYLLLNREKKIINEVTMKHCIAKPFIKWVGGKGQLIPTLVEMLPYDFSEKDELTYIEPFVGGGAMLFFMLQKFKNIKYAVINDLNQNLITAYKTVRNHPKALVRGLDEIQKEYRGIPDEEQRKNFYLSMRSRFNAGGLSDIDNTVLLIFLNRTCFNGLYRVNSKGEFNVPFGRYNNPTICDAGTIYADSKLLCDVEIMSGDFEQTGRYVTSNTFVYFDPPYRPLNATSNFNSYAKEGFNDADQVRLKNFFDRLSSQRCLMMLSNSDCKGYNSDDSFFDELYKDYFIERVYASRFVNVNPEKRGKLTELLIRNYAKTQSLHDANMRNSFDLNIRNYEQDTYRRTV